MNKKEKLDEFKGKLYALLDEYGFVESIKINWKDKKMVKAKQDEAGKKIKKLIEDLECEKMKKLQILQERRKQSLIHLKLTGQLDDYVKEINQQDKDFVKQLIEYNDLKIELGNENEHLTEEEKETHRNCCIDMKMFINELSGFEK